MKKIVVNQLFFDKKDELNFKVFLALKGMSKGNFAKKCNITNGYVSQIIHGQRAFSKEMQATFRKAGFNYNKDYKK